MIIMMSIEGGRPDTGAVAELTELFLCFLKIWSKKFLVNLEHLIK